MVIIVLLDVFRCGRSQHSASGTTGNNHPNLILFAAQFK